jgi:hypothetical protein
MGCNCKKQPVVTTPTISEPVLDELDRRFYPDTPEGQLAYELKLHNKKQQEEFDHFNNLDDYPLIHD